MPRPSRKARLYIGRYLTPCKGQNQRISSRRRLYTAYETCNLVGNESRGISKVAVERSEMCVAIPMFGMIESLNLGTSSGIVLYEITKQRREYQSEFRGSRRKGKRSEPLPTVMHREDGSL